MTVAHLDGSVLKQNSLPLAQEIVTGSQKRNESQCTQENIQGIDVGLERLACDDKRQQFENRFEAVRE